jgi:hypothetical protein
MITASCFNVTQDDSKDKGYVTDIALVIALVIVFQESLSYLNQDVCTTAAISFDEAIIYNAQFHLGGKSSWQSSPVLASILGCNTHTLKLTKRLMIAPTTDQADITYFLAAIEMEVPQQVKRHVISARSV